MVKQKQMVILLLIITLSVVLVSGCTMGGDGDDGDDLDGDDSYQGGSLSLEAAQLKADTSINCFEGFNRSTL
jgi:hypothetical protein